MRNEPGRPRRLSPLLLASLCGLTAIALYLPTLGHGLVWDDVDLITFSTASPVRAFSQSFWEGSQARFLGHDPYYRPLVNLSLGLDRLVGHGRPWFFHLVNILLHGVAVALLALLLRRLTGRSTGPALAALAFGLHPLFTGNIAYVTGRTDIICALGLLLALHGLVRFTRPADRLALLLLLSGYVTALLAKETAVFLVAVAAVWILASRRGRHVSRSDGLTLGGLAAVTAAYLAVRAAVTGSVAPTTGAGFRYLVTTTAEFGRSLASAFFPFASPTFRWNSPSLLWLAPALVFLLLPLALRRRGLPSEAGLGWLWTVAFLLPFAGLDRFGPTGRLLYVPAIGLALLACLVLVRLTAGSRSRQAGASVLALIFCLASALFTIKRLPVWHNGYALFRCMTREAPLNPAGHFNLAFELRARQDTDGAIAEYRTAIALDSTMALAHSNLAALLQGRGRLDEAATLYRRTIALQPDYPLAHNNLGIVLYKQGDFAGAVSELRLARALDPNDAGAAFNLARIYYQTGQPDSAARLIEAAYRLDPDNPLVRSAWRELRSARP